jgi:hypothetical protein
MTETKPQCCTLIYRDWHHYKCTRKATIEVSGKSYCGIHNPETVARRKEKQQQRWAEQNKAYTEKIERTAYDKSMGEICREYGIRDGAELRWRLNHE